MSLTRPLGDQPALRHDADLAAQRLGVRQDVRAEEHRAAAVAQPQDQVAHLAAAERIEAGHRLVEEDNSGSLISACARPTRCSMPFRELAQPHAALAADADLVEHARDPRASTSAPA